MNFTHHPRPGNESWTFDPTRTYVQSSKAMKPSGLWLSVDDDWRRWCTDEQMDWISHDVPVDVDTQQCLLLDTPAALDDFTRTYQSTPAQRYGVSLWIDWPVVAATYPGIIIAPYQWTRRLHQDTSWYYGWDCASACIWDLSAARPATAEAA